MLFFKKKNNPDSDYAVRLNLFFQLLQSHPVQTGNFLDSLTHFTRIVDALSASIYLYEKKTKLFLLKKWSGEKPSRFSISADYEFVRHLRLRESLVFRDEYAKKSANEMRQAALFYFQQTLSTLVCPLRDNGEWLGLLHVRLDEGQKASPALLTGLVALYGDAVKRWLAYQDVFQKNRKLSEVSHVKNQLLANVTHEFQTPLNGILGVAEALLEDRELSAGHSHAVKLIQKSGRALSKTLGNLLELVQIEARKSQRPREKVNLVALIHEVALLFQETCREKGVAIRVPPAGQRQYVFIQPDQIRTVFMNLIGNAVKFTEKGTIAIELTRSGEMVRVTVADTGVGIEEDKLHLIFEEFYQADGSTTRLYGGTGLGLAIVKKIIGLHGGRIWAESQKGVGSTFTFTLPLYPVSGDG